jgi:hypothetical protein
LVITNLINESQKQNAYLYSLTVKNKFDYPVYLFLTLLSGKKQKMKNRFFTSLRFVQNDSYIGIWRELRWGFVGSEAANKPPPPPTPTKALSS